MVFQRLWPFHAVPGTEFHMTKLTRQEALTTYLGSDEIETFLNLPKARPGQHATASAAVIGAGTATPYRSIGAYAANAPAAIRNASRLYAAAGHHLNLDTMTTSAPQGVVDCGDIQTDPDPAVTRARISDAITRIRQEGTVPVLLGGDDSVPIPVIAALAPEPLWIVQIDAHLDWRDEVEGERMGLSSTMRRASEMAHVEGILQLAQRGVGSARPSDYKDARDWGVHFVPAERMDQVDPLAALPRGARVCVAFDFDSLDPSIMPGVIGRAAGGLSYWQAVRLFRDIHEKARIVAVTMAEFVPEWDLGEMGAQHAAQLLANWLGVLTGAGRAPD